MTRPFSHPFRITAVHPVDGVRYWSGSVWSTDRTRAQTWRAPSAAYAAARGIKCPERCEIVVQPVRGAL